MKNEFDVTRQAALAEALPHETEEAPAPFLPVDPERLASSLAGAGYSPEDIAMISSLAHDSAVPPENVSDTVREMTVAALQGHKRFGSGIVSEKDVKRTLRLVDISAEVARRETRDALDQYAMLAVKNALMEAEFHRRWNNEEDNEGEKPEAYERDAEAVTAQIEALKLKQRVIKQDIQGRLESVVTVSRSLLGEVRDPAGLLDTGTGERWLDLSEVMVNGQDDAESEAVPGGECPPDTSEGAEIIPLTPE